MTIEPHWIAPAAITVKIAPSNDLRGRKGGDWDLERRMSFADSVKARSVIQRYRDGADWEETDLFREIYTVRFAREANIRGTRNMPDLIAQYHGRVDNMFADMKANGFRLEGAGKRFPLPDLLIGRDGAVYIGNQGNHRLAIAQLLGLDRFAGRISCWHKLTTLPS